MNSSDLAANLRPEIIDNFRRAIETGKWPDGNALTGEQRELCMQAVITWEYHNLPETERTGYVPPKPACGHEHEHEREEEQNLKWIQNDPK